MTILKNFTVLELTTEISGPYAGQILAQLGANVIKIEKPAGDPQRYNGNMNHNGIGSIFANINKNKKLISLNLKTQDGKNILKKLIEKADVFLHNMRVSAITKLGFDYDEVKKINPSIIYCVITGYDQMGPKKDLPVYDDIIQAESGLVHANSIKKDFPEYVPMAIVDKIASLYMTNSILAAILHKQIAGTGQKIEIPMFETFLTFMLIEHLSFNGPEIYSRMGPYGRRIFKTSTGYISILPYTSNQWLELFKIGDKEKIGLELGVTDRLTRSKNIHEIYTILSHIIIKKSSEHWINACTQLDIPCSPIKTIDELINDSYLKDTCFFKKHTDSSLYLDYPGKFSGIDLPRLTPAQSIGSDTIDVLEKIGYDTDAINTFSQNGTLKEY